MKSIENISIFILQKLGINKAIYFSIGAQIVGVVRSVISIILVTKYLTATEQGYYYTFTSILAIQIFFELGFSVIITQYAAHEKASLNWVNNTLKGNEINLSRLNSLLRLTVKWFSVMSIILFVTLLLGGYIFFYYYAPQSVKIDWELPWVTLSFMTALSLLITPIIAFYEGLGKVENTAKLRFYVVLVNTIALTISLYCDAKLYAYTITNIVGFIINIIWLTSPNIRSTITSVWFYPIQKYIISWRKEIFPYQWKIALSWMSGFFLFQLFNPILFSTVGAEAAGQMGITQATLTGIFGLANSWFSTKIPLFSGLIAQKKYNLLDEIFNKTILQALFVMLVAIISLFIIVSILNYYEISIVNRFINVAPFVILSISSVLLFINNALATYLRCHKQEPFLVSSLVCGIVNVILMFILSKNYGVIGMTIGYLIVMIIGVIWGYYIFINKKRIWHE